MLDVLKVLGGIKLDKTRESLQQNINKISTSFFIDPDYRTIAGQEIEHWNTSLLVVTYALDQNALITGDPGFAKTTAAKVISSVMSGYPFDLYEAAQIQGHPDQTFETMLARLDFSKLHEEERVIWLSSAYLPVRIIDELNRLPAGNQDELLNCLETGRFNYLNSTFFTGVNPFFATANHPDNGTHDLIPALKDRFAIQVELGHLGASYRRDITDARDNIRSYLCNTDLTNDIIGVINNKKLSTQDKLAKILELAEKFKSAEIYTTGDVMVFTSEMKTKFKQLITKIPLATEANVLLECIDSELNYSPTFGRKRSSDKVDTSNHAKNLASSKTENAFSNRGVDRLELYSQAVAYLSGCKQVKKEHINALAPHVIGHRIKFTADFTAEHQDKIRPGFYGESLDMFLARQLVKEVEKNYAQVKDDLDLLKLRIDNKHASLELTLQQRIKDMLENTHSTDHPLIRDYAHRIKREK